LEAQVSEAQEEARILDILNRTGASLASELSLDNVIRSVTDAGVQLSGAQFGAFFYNIINKKGEAYTPHTLSGAPREAFSSFLNPRITLVFEPIFSGTGPIRFDDIPAMAKILPIMECLRGICPYGAILPSP
jgi:GAF domain-containing protein